MIKVIITTVFLLVSFSLSAQNNSDNKPKSILIQNVNKTPMSEDIKNTRIILGVFVNGKWIDKKEIYQMMKVKKWNDENKDKYKWKDRKKF